MSNPYDFFQKVKQSQKDDTCDSQISIFETIQKQKHSHRKCLVNFAIVSTSVAMAVLFIIIIGQGIVRYFISNFTVLDGYQLTAFMACIFPYSFGVLRIIAKSLWDDKSHKEMMKYDQQIKSKTNDSGTNRR